MEITMAERWQEYEKVFLRRAPLNMEVEIIAGKLERTEAAIIQQAKKMRLRRVGDFKLKYNNPKRVLSKWRDLIKPCDRWTSEELSLFNTHSNQQISELTGRSEASIGDRRLLENLRRNGWLTKN
jgi:hypothetical protein